MGIANSIKTAPGAVKLTFLYCLPAAIAIGLVLWSYYVRTLDVAAFIKTQRNYVEAAFKDTQCEQDKSAEEKSCHQLENVTRILEDKKSSPHLKRLIEHYIRNHEENASLGVENYIKKDDELIKQEIESIWLSNSIKIAILAIFPFLLLGTHLGFSTRQLASYEIRASVVNRSWWIKFLIGMILAYGWIYVINPIGRGAGTLEQFLINVDFSKPDSIPEILKGGVLHPIIAGFLGWYLYLLTYFFSKTFAHDVLSTNAYGLMFQKFLFTYGVAIILPSVQATTGVSLDTSSGFNTTVVLAFLVGYFPMSAFSLLKDSGLKILQNKAPEKGQLHELPGISRWQILRLEEEGIDSIAALAAYSRPHELRQNIPALGNLINYWIDISRLYTVLGQDNYLIVKKHCQTASEFVLKSNDNEFIQTLSAENVVNPGEIARILENTFTTSISTT